MEPSDIRKRVLHTLEQARRRAQVQREESDRATEAFGQVLPGAAAVWKQAANVLRAEGHAFTVQTPGNLLRFAAGRSGDDGIEVALDTTRRPPAVVVRTRLTRGGHVVDRESVVAEADEIAQLDDARLLAVLLSELEPFVER